MADSTIYIEAKQYVRMVNGQRPDGGSEVFWFCLNTLRWRWQTEDKTTLYDDVDERLNSMAEEFNPVTDHDKEYAYFFIRFMVSRLSPGLSVSTVASYVDLLEYLNAIYEDVTVEHMDISLQGRRLKPSEFKTGRRGWAAVVLSQAIEDAIQHRFANVGAFIGVVTASSSALHISTSEIECLWRRALQEQHERST